MDINDLIYIIGEYTQVPINEITEQSFIKSDLSLCSYDLMAIFASIEEKIKIDLNLSNISNLSTLRDILDIINIELDHQKEKI